MQDQVVKITRGKRKANPVSPFRRIKSLKGIDTIKSIYETAVNSSVAFIQEVPLEKLKHISSPDLIAIRTDQDSIQVECHILANSPPDQYPTKKVRCDSKKDLETLAKQFGEDQKEFDQSSLPLDLHRLSALDHADWNEELLELDAVHRCHNKRCFARGHVYYATKDENRSTEF
jgi:hypothetical protein